MDKPTQHLYDLLMAATELELPPSMYIHLRTYRTREQAVKGWMMGLQPEDITWYTNKLKEGYFAAKHTRKKQ